MSLNLSSDEHNGFDQLFKVADKQDIGVLTGEEAVPFLEKSGLSPQVLGQIWQISDSENRGFLTFSAFSIAMRLIALAQEKRPFDYRNPGKIPYFSGIQLSNVDPSSIVQPFFSKTPSSTTHVPSNPTGSNTLPPIAPEELTRYQKMFTTVCSADSLMDGDRASSIFGRAPLSTEVLAQIWNLVDTRKRGALDIREFNTGMHLINLLLSGTIKSPPPSISPSFIATAVMLMPAQSPPAQNPMRTSNAPPSSDPWTIPPQDINSFCQLFNNVDKARKGYISGSEAYSFFLASKLPEDVLAHIWDLSDTNSSGKLNLGEFCIALFLIKMKLQGKELPSELFPSTLASVSPLMQHNTPVVSPQSTTQPSMPTSQVSPKFVQPTRVSSGTEDLLSLDQVSFSPSPQPQRPFNESKPQANQDLPQKSVYNHQPLQTNSTPGVVASPTGSVSSPLSGFVPQSNFGQSIAKVNLDKSGMPSKSGTPPVVAPVPQMSSNENMKLAAELPKMEAQLQQASNNNKIMMQEAKSASDSHSDTQTKLAEIRKAYNEELAKTKQITSETDAKRLQTQQMKKDYGILEATLEALKKQNDEKKLALEEVHADLETATSMLNNSNASIQALQDDIAQQEQTLTDLHQQLDTVTQQLVNLDRKNKSLLEKKDGLSLNVDNTEKQLSSAKNELETQMKNLSMNHSSREFPTSAHAEETAPSPLTNMNHESKDEGHTRLFPQHSNNLFEVPARDVRSPSLNSAASSSARASSGVSKNPFHKLKFSENNSPVSNFWENEFASTVFPHNTSKESSMYTNPPSKTPSLDTEMRYSAKPDTSFGGNSHLEVSSFASQRGSPVSPDMAKLTESTLNTPASLERSNERVELKPPVPPSRREKSASSSTKPAEYSEEEFPPIEFKEKEEESSDDEEQTGTTAHRISDTPLSDANEHLKTSTTTHVEAGPASSEPQYSVSTDTNPNKEKSVPPNNFYVADSSDSNKPFDFETANESDNDEFNSQPVPITSASTEDAFNVDDEFSSEFQNLQAAEVNDKEDQDISEDEESNKNKL
ncbi:EPS15 repeat family actin cortical patch component [Schizosaccharomyces cryophilus OY26]|uniref:EPS15 repeat family actin cortical patch component n=1 Tax=Schizosaccharomyces cryophilus (strain OY26 / ATCC MYA-4695 / CBS 11777 / NBRC 106824 / NRRL Y48691) TaxID=653667 RepID=S9VZM9_SCHCR|nr:EPS15 repeat family actin cortical patch component [Schizosaccharomyces cryophilus OY26]EPY53113.1 EPS15 repeat family actin cortical patch component [Schizosaccharomyces cryophilus OY26]